MELGSIASRQNRGPAGLDRFTDPIPSEPVLRLRRLLHLRMSSGGILRNQADRGKTWTFHSPGNGTGWVKRRNLFDKFSNQ